jgi:hypothetical protein
MAKYQANSSELPRQEQDLPRYRANRAPVTKELALQVELCSPGLLNVSRSRGVTRCANGSAGFGRNPGRRARPQAYSLRE